MQESDEGFFIDETKYWLALCKWKDLKPQPAINDLKDLLSSTDSVELQSRIYLVLGEIYLENDIKVNLENNLSLSNLFQKFVMEHLP